LAVVLLFGSGSSLNWVGIEKIKFTTKLEKRLEERDTWQGKKF